MNSSATQSSPTWRSRNLWLVAAVALVALTWAVTGGTLLATPAAEVADGGDEVLAIVEGQKLLRSEVEAKIIAGLAKLDRERHQLIEQGLNQLIAETVLNKKAEKERMTRDEFLTSKITDPTPEEVDAFYVANQARIKGTKEQVAGQIQQFLRQQQVGQLLQSLRAEADVVMLLEPLRSEIRTQGAPTKGNEDAPLTIVEFSDFQCPYCARINPTLEKVKEKYGDQVRFVFRQFPLNNIHPQAQKAAEAALCAFDQDKFWEMHDAMFAGQSALGVDALKTKAGELGLDGEEFAACLDSGRHQTTVNADAAEGRQLGVTGTPALFVNGRTVAGGAASFESLSALLDEELERLGT